MISVIMVQYNNARLTLDAIRSLQQHHPDGIEILVVDNASTDGSLDLIRESASGITVIASPANNGFGVANNLGVAQAHGKLICFLNNDTVCRGEFLATAGRRFAEFPDLGIYGPRLVYPDGTFQLSAGTLPGFWREIAEKLVYALERRHSRPAIALLERFFASPRRVGWVTGAALVIRKPVFEQIGRFDESMFMYFEDKDLCARAWKAGYFVEYDPSVSVVHLKGGSSPGGPNAFIRSAYRSSQRVYYEKHRPAYERLLLSWYQRLIGEGGHG